MTTTATRTPGYNRRLAMKRTTLIQRDIAGEPVYEVKGWAAEIDGVPVVLCRSEGDRGRWLVYEPSKGREVCGTRGDTREAVLACAAERVAKVADSRGASPGEFLRELIEGAA